MKCLSVFCLIFFFILSCTKDVSSTTRKVAISEDTNDKNSELPLVSHFESNAKTIHIFVALCDNQYQGIVPVPKAIGNGQDPKNNLYWGTAYGIKTYFKNSSEWRLLKSYAVDSMVLERCIFKHTSQDYYLVADAYNGKDIKQTTIDFLNSSAGLTKDTLQFDNQIIGINGNANLVSYIGHDGLMDFEINQSFQNVDNKQRDVIILACYSKHFFQPHLENANVNPLVWTTNLMAPEAYTIHDAITGYIQNESNEEIRNRAAKAYAKYQKCSLKAAKGLLVSN